MVVSYVGREEGMMLVDLGFLRRHMVISSMVRKVEGQYLSGKFAPFLCILW
jgi:hypothetical protein